jgi:hypothetical protein
LTSLPPRNCIDLDLDLDLDFDIGITLVARSPIVSRARVAAPWLGLTAR